MWIPKSTEEIETRVKAGNLEETATFDAKREISNREIAKDVAAMANDGGMLLYGIGEDDEDRLTVLHPLTLPGLPERISQIVETGIAEPPQIRIKSFPTSDDPSMGYLAVLVPPSPRAPHMVIKSGDNRYYGRTDKTNKRLTEGDVARLYARRQQWERNQETFLEELIAQSPLEPRSDFGYLHIASTPILKDDSLLDQARGKLTPITFLNELVGEVKSPSLYNQQFYPDFDAATWERQINGWIGYMARDLQRSDSERDPDSVLDLQVHFDGSMHLFCGRAAAIHHDELVVIEPLVAGLTVRFCFLSGKMYERAQYLGPVDIAMAVTGIDGAISYSRRNRYGSGVRSSIYCPPLSQSIYRRSTRVLASQLVDDPYSVARTLGHRLTRALTQDERDFFQKP